MRVRLLAGAALAALAGATAMLAFGMGPFAAAGTTESAALPQPTPPAKAGDSSRTAPAERQTKVVPKPAQVVDEAPVVPVVPEPEIPASGLPTPIAEALELHSVVVVSLVSPTAPVDELALREARAGAAQAGVGFVRIPVVSQTDMTRLTATVGVRHTPSLLVFTRPDRLFVQVKGFADRETVAQAATNATS